MSPSHSRPAVVFDLGGVLLEWDSRDVIATAPVSPDHRERLVAHLLPSPDWTEFDRGTLDLPDLIERCARRSGLDHEVIARFFDHVGDYLQPQSETVALLRDLANTDVPLYCLSNMPRCYIDRLERDCTFFDHFIAVYASSRLGLIKPEPAIFEHLLKDAGLVAQQTWFIDDMGINVEAAARHGINGIRFESAAQCRHELVRAGVARA